MELNFYCSTCEQLVCHYCTITYYNAHEHNAVEMANKRRVELDKIIEFEPVEKMINETNQNITAARESIQIQATEVDQQIDDYYDQLQRRIQQQREEMKKELHEIFSHKKKTVLLRLEQIEHTQVQLENVKN